MIRLKLAGCALLILAGYTAGYMKAEKSKKIVAYLQDYRNFLQYIRILALTGDYSPDEILKKAVRQGSCPELVLEKVRHLREYRLPDWLPNDLSELSGVFSLIGAVQKQELQLLLLQYDRLAAEREKTAKENDCKAKSLYTRLGALIAALIAVMIL